MPGEWNWMDKLPSIPGLGQDTMPSPMPTDDAALQLALKRRLAQADALRQTEAPQGQMISGHYVAPSWTQNLANLYGKYRAGQDESAALQEYNQAQASKAQKLGELMKGQTVFETDEAGNQREVQKPYSNEELIGKLAEIDSSYAPELFKSYITNQFKEDTPMVVGKNLVTKTGKVLYSAPEEPKAQYANVQHDPKTGKFLGLNLKTNRVEEVPGAALTPTPDMTPYQQWEKNFREREASKKEANNFDDATVDMLADQALAGDKSVFTGRGMTGANIGAIRNRMNQKMIDRGWNGADIAAKNAEFMGFAAGERAVGTKGAQIQLAGSEFTNIVPLAKQAGDKVSRSGFLPFGKVEVMFNEQTNDPNMNAFAAYNNGLVNTYARAISPTGVPSVSDKQHARELLLTAKNQTAYNATVDALTREIEAAKRSPRETRESLREEYSGHKPSAGGIPSKDDIAAEIARRRGR